MALIWNGAQIPCEAHVLDWRSSKLAYAPGKHGCGVRKKVPELFIVHYTGAENPPDRFFHNLAASGKSVEFGMDYHGQIWQFTDPALVYCAHAHGANAFSFGMEIQSRGIPFLNDNDVSPKRGTYVADMEWGKQKYVHFTRDQIEALCQFVDALTAEKILPKKLAMAKKDIHKRIPKREWPTLRGVAGHYHVDVQDTSAKIDPGPQVFDELWENFG